MTHEYNCELVDGHIALFTDRLYDHAYKFPVIRKFEIVNNFRLRYLELSRLLP